MDLFDIANEKKGVLKEPLAERMRAKTLKDFIGQEHIVSETSLLNRAIKLEAWQLHILGATRYG